MMAEETKKGNLKKELLNREVNLCAGSTILLNRCAIDKIGLFDESFERHLRFGIFNRGERQRVGIAPELFIMIRKF